VAYEIEHAAQRDGRTSVYDSSLVQEGERAEHVASEHPQDMGRVPLLGKALLQLGGFDTQGLVNQARVFTNGRSDSEVVEHVAHKPAMRSVGSELVQMQVCGYLALGRTRIQRAYDKYLDGDVCTRPTYSQSPDARVHARKRICVLHVFTQPMSEICQLNDHVLLGVSKPGHHDNILWWW
jgi:hypothetical protein